MRERWYYCIEHARVEPRKGCPVKDRLGPYDTREEAATALDRVARRNVDWDDEDRRWDES
ncbi:MAG: hypothetical protein OEX04_07845 [Acidimicrobiia bacterium]|nr:hypothetical protein [Acidimicrobiia bacterium]MDH4307378.1 hypothetical protein [Acidimicrobiia bacterium]MDH5292995.1 hypothetical protein [Acidimicrobiia bacterium]